MRIADFKQRVDYRRKIIGIAQLRENTIESIFDKSLENRVEVFSKYYCAKEFFRRVYDYKHTEDLRNQKLAIADDHYRLRTLTKNFNILKESTGRLNYIEEQLITIYQQSLVGKAYEALRNYYVEKSASIPLYSPYQVFLSYGFIKAICPDEYFEEPGWQQEPFFEIPTIFEIKRPKISIKANENLNWVFIERCFKGWKRLVDLKKTFVMKRELEKKAISFIILKNYFIDKSYRRHI